MMPRWFLCIGGASLLILGALQIQARPHERGDSFYKRFVNFGTLWSLCCIAVGAGLLLMAMGYVSPVAVAPSRSPALRRPPLTTPH